MEVRHVQYETSPLKHAINISPVYTIHYFKYGKNFKVAPEVHDFWEMVYVDSGEVGIIADDKEFTLKQGEAFFHRPNELHTIYTNNSFGNSAIISFDCHGKYVNLLADKIFVFGEFEKTLLSKIIFETPICFSDKLNEIYLTHIPQAVCLREQDVPVSTGDAVQVQGSYFDRRYATRTDGHVVTYIRCVDSEVSRQGY